MPGLGVVSRLEGEGWGAVKTPDCINIMTSDLDKQFITDNISVGPFRDSFEFLHETCILTIHFTNWTKRGRGEVFNGKMQFFFAPGDGLSY